MFYGNNEIDEAKLIMMYRAKYILYSYGLAYDPYYQDPKMVRDMNYAESNFYGRVDAGGYSVYPNPESVQSIGANPNGGMIMGLPFINTMLSDVKNNIQMKINFQELWNDNINISAMTPSRAYESPISNYMSHLQRILITFNMDYINELGADNITSLKDYVKHLMIYIREERVGMPTTFTGWNLSGLNSIYGTGLAVSIAGDGFGNDVPKQKFINSTMFPYYKSVIMQKGFLINKQAPWCLIADLGSPAFNRVVDEGLQGTGNVVENVFSNYFLRTSEEDIRLFKRKVFDFYNDFVNFNKRRRRFHVTCRKVSTTHIERNTINYTNKYYNSFLWYLIYLELRNIENNLPFTDDDIKTKQKRIIKMVNKFDDLNVAGYIDDEFVKMLFKKPFGHADIRKRIKKRNEYRLSEKLKGNASDSGGSSGGY